MSDENDKELIYRPPDKGAYLKIILIISNLKHMLWVLKRTVSVRRFLSIQNMLQLMGKKIIATLC